MKGLIDEVPLYNIDDNLINGANLYAHTHDSKEAIRRKKPETILEHSKRTIHFFSRLSEDKGILKIVKNIIALLKIKNENIDEESAKLILEMFINAIYLHDLGKINPAFQVIKMANNKVELKNSPETNDSSHSLISALLFVDIYFEKIKSINGRIKSHYMKQALFRFAYIISRHHTYLEDLEAAQFLDNLKKFHERIKSEHSYIKYYKNTEHFYEKLDLNIFNNINKLFTEDTFEFYTLSKLLYSIIVSCDFYATSLYMEGRESDFGTMKDIGEYLEEYENSQIYKGIMKYEKDNTYFGANSINTLRSEMFLEAEKNLKDNVRNSNIYYLEAPTGSGKTNTSINLAVSIIKELPEVNKIIYVFPFNTLVDQTKKSLDTMFPSKSGNRKIAVINSITPIITEKEKNDNNEDTIDYKKDYLNRQMLHYPIILTTHINFFNYLFGVGREINLPLIQLCNSVVIMDEIQSYRNKIWPEIIEFLSALSKLLNFKIIIMSATLPKLDKLLRLDKLGFCELIRNKDKYYQNKLFKNRVSLNFELIKGNEKTTEEVLFSRVNEVISANMNKRILIEFISKTSARNFYEKLKEEYPIKKIYEITGDDSSFVRNKILKEINELNDNGDFINKDIIIVATQVIEAGVDIDMDIGFKDISLLDGEEQFLGRINRSCKREGCRAYFFNMDKAEKIYREDWRLEKDLTDKKYQEYLENKDFGAYYELCFQRLKEMKTENNENNIENLDEAVKHLDFKKVCDMMRLILDENYQVFLPYTIKDDKFKLQIDGKKVWSEYKELLNDNEMDYAEKKIKLSIVGEKMSYFTFNYVDLSSKTDKTPKLYDEVIGRVYYVANGDKYITEDGKFNRKLFMQDSGGLFL